MDKKPANKNKNHNKIIVNLVYLLLITCLFVGLIFSTSSTSQLNTNDKIDFTQLISYIRDGKVSKIQESEGSDQIKVEVYKDSNQDKNNVEAKYTQNVSSGKGKSILEYINIGLGDQKIELGDGKKQIQYVLVPESSFNKLFSNPLFQFFIQFAIFGVIALFIIRRLSDANNKSISFGSTRAKTYDNIDTKEKITFADVAGNEEAKLELTEVIDFLKRPEEYEKMGAKIPKGVLLIGQPGNGKTLMAKAVAGEADVPFLFVSGSEFVEMFVGVGAGRVRDLFKKAKKKSPCVIFIDEIDAVGRQSGAGLGGGNDEREQTLNQILVEMDGFEPTSAVIVIGATNRPDVLDPALLRPGRFDRQVTVTAPDRQEREQILKVHSKNKKFADDIDLTIVAKRTAGFSGADLANVLNEAAILAVREKSLNITNNILREAIEKVILGPSLKTKVITEEQKKLTAYHEAGHALVSTVTPGANKVQKITIIPRGRAAGYTFSDQGEQDPITRKRSEFLADITVLFGGYTVEKLVFGEVSTGASNDLSKATEIARNMVTKYGMSELGPISYEESKGLSFLGKDMVEGKHYSENSAMSIDQEIQKILFECYTNCKKIITKYRADLDKIAQSLVDNEVLEYEEFKALTSHIEAA
ncbi:MAG: ATP-dependent zinc metalloprotease FtsH [candidate division SR1 bacterium]|nr:ATP-dependent zinc metalloprotease FtsH [candidate division SR1 bacterium]